MPKKIDLTGQKIGRLMVISPAPNKGRRTQWNCKCECGNDFIALTESLRSGKTRSCGCLRSEITAEKNKNNIINLIGQHFGKLTVIQQAESYRNHSAWICECECGNIITVNSVELKKGDTLSCGCLRSSYGESLIKNILTNNQIDFKKEYSFEDLLSEKNIPLRFDFAIFKDGKLSHLIEYDGEQHFSNKGDNKLWSDSFEKRKERDKLKTEYCKKHNIPLIRIPYWEKENITLEKLMIN